MMTKERDTDWFLPVELWMRHILCLLPVKTLLVMRAVSKFFLAMINDESLTSIHLRSFSSNPTSETRLVFLFLDYMCRPGKMFYSTSFQANCIISQRTCFDDLMITPSFATKLRFPYPPNASLVEGSLDGLVLLRVQREDCGLEGAALWNPSIRKTRQLPIPSVSVSTSGFSEINLGLGYDPCSKDYKVLAMASLMHRSDEDDNLQSWGVWVYSVLKTRSWTPVFNSGLSMWTHRVNFWDMCEPMSFKGCLFWIETGWGFLDSSHPKLINGVDASQRLTRFDLATHQFSYSDVPPYTLHEDEWYDQKLARIEGDGWSCLAVAESVDYGTGRVAIWAMDNVETMAWTRRYLAYELYIKYWTRATSETNHIIGEIKCPITRRAEAVGTYVESLLLLN